MRKLVVVDQLAEVLAQKGSLPEAQVGTPLDTHEQSNVDTVCKLLIHESSVPRQ